MLIYHGVAQFNTVEMSGTVIDLSQGNMFKKTVTGTTIFTVTNVPSGTLVTRFVLEITNGGPYIQWWPGILWDSGMPPVLTTNGLDVFGFYTNNSGGTWRGFILGKGVA